MTGSFEAGKVDRPPIRFARRLLDRYRNAHRAATRFRSHPIARRARTRHFKTHSANGPATGFELGPNAQAVIADASYADFSLDFDSVELELPTLFLRDGSGPDFTIGTDSSLKCAISEANHLHVVRSGSSVSVTVDTNAPFTCGNFVTPTARLTIGFRGPNPPSNVSARVRNVVVVRN